MVSPKRAWPPREKDAESAESAAFEATVAVVKETVVRSGEVLVSAKEDLSDHKRWLEIQRAAGQADRLRHERWLRAPARGAGSAGKARGGEAPPKADAPARCPRGRERDLHRGRYRAVGLLARGRQGRSLLQLYRLVDCRRLLLGDRAAQRARCLCREADTIRCFFPRGEGARVVGLDRRCPVGCRLVGRGEIGCAGALGHQHGDRRGIFTCSQIRRSWCGRPEARSQPQALCSWQSRACLHAQAHPSRPARPAPWRRSRRAFRPNSPQRKSGSSRNLPAW